MSEGEDLGMPLPSVTLWLARGRDFHWTYQLQSMNSDGSASGNPKSFQMGRLFLVFDIPDLSYGAPEGYSISGMSVWEFQVFGAGAEMLVPNTIADAIPVSTPWQQVWMPEGTFGGLRIRQGLVNEVLP
jgi:hypothetical protein